MFKEKSKDLCKVVRDFNYFLFLIQGSYFNLLITSFLFLFYKGSQAYLNVSDLGEKVLSEGGNKVGKIEHDISSFSVPMTTPVPEFSMRLGKKSCWYERKSGE